MPRKTLSFVCLAVLAAAFALSQPSTAIIEGIVTDTTGGVIPGATVTIENLQTGVKVKVITDSLGRYSAVLPGPGEFRVTVEFPPFQSTRFEVKLTAGSTIRRDVSLELGETVETVSVSSTIPQIQTMSAQMAIGGYNTEEYGHVRENGFHNVRDNPLSTFSVDVDTASYANVRRFLRDGSFPPADAVRIEELVNYFQYGYPEPSGDSPFSISTEMARCPWKPSHLLLRVGLKTRSVAMENLPPNNLVFLLDVSGSMSDHDKLPLLLRGFALLAQQLRPQDRVAIVVYAGAAGQVLPSTSGAEKDKILSALARLQAGGSTAGGAGIQLAYDVARQNFLANGNNRVILATDGDFNVGASSDGEMIRLIEKEREAGVFLTVLGFGEGNIKDSKMEQLADHGNGSYHYIDSLIEARRVLVEQLGATLLTVAKDVKIQIEFNPAHVQAYRLIGYENRLLEAEDFRDDTKDAGDVGAGHVVTALYELVPPGAAEEPRPVDELRYQTRATSPAASSAEALTLKVRYKPPDADASSELSQAVLYADTPVDGASEDLRFAAAVAGFGMLLRESEHRGECTWDTVAELADSARGPDPDGRRSEFVYLVKTATNLARSN